MILLCIYSTFWLKIIIKSFLYLLHCTLYIIPYILIDLFNISWLAVHLPTYVIIGLGLFNISWLAIHLPTYVIIGLAFIQHQLVGNSPSNVCNNRSRFIQHQLVGSSPSNLYNNSLSKNQLVGSSSTG